ncbi:MAG: hypothetical protein HY744_27545 [Deltaproteobacteria bacterium]|nr:hypothetical protein [Deltaproteobacteria bacterium]
MSGGAVRATLAALLCAAATAACAAPGPGAPAPAAGPTPAETGAPRPDAATPARADGTAPAPPAPGASSEDAGALGGAAPPAPSAPPAAIGPEDARAILFPVGPAPSGCDGLAAEREIVRCLIAARFAPDRVAAGMAVDLYDRTGDVAGVLPEQVMDGGWRGVLRLVPEPPLGPHRLQLQYVAAATRDIDRFLVALQARAGRPLSYRWQPLGLRFFRSVGRTTPSAMAERWAVAYNVRGSLHVSADAVRETLFHEIWHLNDAAHDNWSSRALGDAFASILARCPSGPGGLPSRACLAPWAPHSTTVRGGTYYAFQPGGGVGEYGAELAVRYFEEQLRALGPGRAAAARPFKCGPEPNATAWKLLADEFFAGADLVPGC